MLDSSKILYEDDNHQYIWFSWEDPETNEALVQTNQVLVINGNQGYLMDPGGAFTFSEVAAEINKYLPLGQIRYLLATHQDPDVLSSAALWLKATNARLLVSRLWVRFISHYGFNDLSRIIPIEDRGKKIRLPEGGEIILLPAHFLHSEGNFSYYDTRSKILFSGDLGTAFFPKGQRYFMVENWEEHLVYTEDFHRRYMGSNAALRKWVSLVRQYDVEMIVPQHGAVIGKQHIESFLNWLENLQCGTDLLEDFYGF